MSRKPRSRLTGCRPSTKRACSTTQVSVKQCENFVEGKQWEGLKSKNLRPITMNVLDPIVHYKVAQIVSNDVDQEVEPFLPDEQAEYAAKILEQSIDRVVERTKLKSKHHMVLRDACVDGDAAL